MPANPTGSELLNREALRKAEGKAWQIWETDWPLRPSILCYCTFCGRHERCIGDILEGTAMCRDCYVERTARQLMAEEENRQKKPKLDVEDFARL